MAEAMEDTTAVELTATSNPYLDFYRAFCAEHPGELTRVFDPALDEQRRAEMYAALDVSIAMVSNSRSLALERKLLQRLLTVCWLGAVEILVGDSRRTRAADHQALRTGAWMHRKCRTGWQ